MSRLLLVATLFVCSCLCAVASAALSSDNSWSLDISGSFLTPLTVSSTAPPASPLVLNVIGGPHTVINSQSVGYHVYPTHGFPPLEQQPVGYRMVWTGKDGELYMYGNDGNVSRFVRSIQQWQLVIPAKGDPEADHPPSWGIRLQGNTTTYPGQRNEGCIATDDDGNVWLSGGTISTGSGGAADLWKLDMNTQIWTWMAGVNDDFPADPNYNSKGTPISGANIGPGTRSQHGCTWSNGKLYLFGHVGSDYRNDLWTYDPSADAWTWLHGSKEVNTNAALASNWGTRGVPADSNLPLPRAQPAFAADGKGSIWMIGGTVTTADYWGISSNDVWKYTISTNQWTWISGNQTWRIPIDYSSDWPAYRTATKNVAITPRHGAAHAMDKKTGLLYMGTGRYDDHDGSGEGSYSDAWFYNTNTDEWTFFAGCGAIDAELVNAGDPVPDCDSLQYASGWVDQSGNWWWSYGQAIQGFNTDKMWMVQAPANSVSIKLTPAANANVSSSNAWKGLNYFALSVAVGTTHEMTFSIIAQDGTVGTPYTVRIVEAACPSDGSPCSQYVPINGTPTYGSTGSSGTPGSAGTTGGGDPANGGNSTNNNIIFGAGASTISISFNSLVTIVLVCLLGLRFV